MRRISAAGVEVRAHKIEVRRQAQVITDFLTMDLAGEMRTRLFRLLDTADWVSADSDTDPEVVHAYLRGDDNATVYLTSEMRSRLFPLLGIER